MVKIYKSTGGPVYAVRLFHEFTDRTYEDRYVEINAATGKARWGVRGYRDFMEDPEYHEVAGEIDLDGVILEAIKRAVKERRKNELERGNRIQ